MKEISKINHIFDSIREDGFGERKYVFKVSEELKQNIGVNVEEFEWCCIQICSDQWQTNGYECLDVYLSNNLEYVVVEVEKYIPVNEKLITI